MTRDTKYWRWFFIGLGFIVFFGQICEIEIYAEELSAKARRVLENPPEKLESSIQQELSRAWEGAVRPIYQEFLPGLGNKFSYRVRAVSVNNRPYIYFLAKGKNKSSGESAVTKLTLEVFFKGGEEPLERKYGLWFQPLSMGSEKIELTEFPADRAAFSTMMGDGIEAFYWQKGEHYVEVHSQSDVKSTAQKVQLKLQSLKFYDFPNSLLPSVVGAKPTKPVKTGSGLHDAAESGDLEKVKILIASGADVNAQGSFGALPLGLAAGRGHLEVVRTLIQAGADVNWEATHGQTALNVAAHMGHHEVLKALIEAGADVNQKVKSSQVSERFQGATALFFATESDSSETIKTLLQSGSDLNSINQMGMTPLMLAINSDNLGPLLTLIEAGAKVDAKKTVDSSRFAKGSTPLMGAANEGNLQVVKVLLLAGAKADARNVDGKTAYKYASEKGHTEIARILQDPQRAKLLAKRALEKELINFLEGGNLELFKGLIGLGLNPNMLDDEENFVLVKAVENASLDTIKTLVEAGADVNVRDPVYRASPLMIAAQKGRVDIVNFLIESGAEINKKAKGNRKGEGAGWTALMAAAMEGHTEVVSNLLSEGADPTVVNQSGKTALDIAKKEGNSEVVRLLETSF